MGIDLSDGYRELRRHVGHDVACVCYAPGYVYDTDPANVALECNTCGEILVDFDHPDTNEEEG
jgi:hypothetical protein